MNTSCSRFESCSWRGTFGNPTSEANFSASQLDAIAALQWVKHNISSFGGDPNRITVFGQSAGSYLINKLMISPLASGLFHAAIAESSADMGDMQSGDLAHAEQSGVTLAKGWQADSLDALRRVPVEKILATDFAARPIVDGYVIPQDTYTSYALGQQIKVPLLLGYNDAEGEWFQLSTTLPKYRKFVARTYGTFAPRFLQMYPAINDDQATAAKVRIAGEDAFGWQMYAWAESNSRTSSAPTFFYHFRARSGNGHGAELPYVFNFPFGGRWNLEQRRLGHEIEGYWTRFAATGNPNGDGAVMWKPYDPAVKHVMALGAKTGEITMPDMGPHLLMDEFQNSKRVPQDRTGSTRSTSLRMAEKTAVVETVGEILAVNYVFPDRAALAKARITGAMAAGDYDGITDPSNFAKRLTADLHSVIDDRHLKVSAASGEAAPSDGPPAPYDAGFVRVDRLKGNIGYIKLLRFPIPGPFDLAADQAMADLKSTDALIIDMRDNRGGNPDSVAYFCSFFFDPKTRVHVNNLIYRKPGTNEFTTTEFWTKPLTTYYLRKPVYLLTSKRTFSGGEEFVNDLKAQKRAKVVGEVTGGGANPGDPMPINSRFSIFVPNGRAENPVTKTSWEGTGVTPDVTVDEKHAFQTAMLEIVSKRAKSEAASIKTDISTQTEVDPLVEAHLLKYRTTALSGSAEAMRRNLEELVRGTPNYELMSPYLANVTRAQLPQLQADLSKLGAIKTVTFKHVGSDGLDVYDVTLENGAIQCGIFVMPDGKIVSAWVRPAAA